MFDDLSKELRKLERGIQIPIEVPLDEDRYFDRKCPASSCQAEFKVLFDHWEEKVSDERAFCPICRHQAPATEWNTEEQLEYIKSVVLAEAHKTINRALKRDARRFNRKQKSGFIQLSLSVKPSSPPVILPIEAAEIMRQQFVCPLCGCHYACIGAAFFCPACGHNLVVVAFEQTVETVQRMVSIIPSIQSTVADAYSADVARNSVRLTLEDSLARLVGVFQRIAEALFEQLPNSADLKRRRNVFQNLSESSTLWKSATGKGYDDILTPDELNELECLFQKRHLIAHCDGIVDQAYIDKSGNTTYAVGQRIVIQESDVLRLGALIEKLAGTLQDLVDAV